MTTKPVHAADETAAGAELVVAQFGDADEIEISTRRDDGTLRAFVPIWIVSVDGALYVRSYRGADGAWYRHATVHHDRQAGAIRAGGQQADVKFTQITESDADLLESIGQAYRTKYARYGNTYLQPMLAPQAVAATVRLNPSSP